MTEVILATSNQGKIKEFENLLAPAFKVISPSHTLLVNENGKTYRENAKKKALVFFQEFKRPVLSDDSGLEVDVLNGAPGLFSARLGGESLSWPERWKYLLEQLRPFPEETWTSQFRAVLCYYDGNTPEYFEGIAKGRIVEPCGSKGFGYDPLFFSDELKKTFGEATNLEKQNSSHRAFAVRALIKWWESRL